MMNPINPCPDGYKMCPQCNKCKPLTHEHFYRSSRYKDGFQTHCKECHLKYYYDKSNEINKQAKEHYAKTKKKNRDVPDGYQRCSVCKNIKQLSDFGRQSKSKNGFRGQCKECRKLENPQSKKRSRRHWEEKKHIQNAKRRTPEHRTHSAELRRKNPAAYRAKKLRRRARENGLPYTFTEADHNRMMQYWDHRCCVCGREAKEGLIIAVDHWIPISDPRPDNPGTVPANLLPMCHTVKDGDYSGCNNTKSFKDPMIWLVERIGESKAQEVFVRIKAYFESLC